MSEKMNLLSNAKTVKAKMMLNKAPDFVLSFTVIYPRRGSRKESELLGLGEFLLLLSHTLLRLSSGQD